MRINRLGVGVCVLALAVSFLAVLGPVSAQQSQGNGGLQLPPNWSVLPNSPTANTVIPRNVPGEPAQAGTGELALEAYLTADGQRIDRGLVWRIFRLEQTASPAKPVDTRRDAAPVLRLPAGRYAVNAAFGRAHLTQVINVASGAAQRERFVLNAGGLRVRAQVTDGAEANALARYDIFSDERDQSGRRKRVVTDARPGLIIRLNAGIYQIVSRMGDANSQLSSDVAVEAGKLTEATVSHDAAQVIFKLVSQTNGEAIADTQWIIMTETGDVVKESAGAIPTHVLAAGNYSVSARWRGQLFTRTFSVKSGNDVEVEVLRQ